jgi:hypothetical protein
MSLVGSALEELCCQSESQFIHDENEIKLMAGNLQSFKGSVGLSPDLDIKLSRATTTRQMGKYTIGVLLCHPRTYCVINKNPIVSLTQ